MNRRGMTRNSSIFLLVTCAYLLLLLISCQAPNHSTDLTQKNTTTEKPTSPTTQIPAQTTHIPSNQTVGTTLAFSEIVQNFDIETIAAVFPSNDAPWWEIAPQHTRITLQGYPISNHIMKPQIFIYPVAELGKVNEAAGLMASDLQILLKERQLGRYLPLLPLFNASQAMHTHVEYLDFMTGHGVRFLIQLDQGPVPINNYEIFYSFQGITSDGVYYVSALLPVNHPELPPTMQFRELQTVESEHFFAYMAKTVSWLEEQDDNSFNPDLAKLDAFIAAIDVR
jgi:hypothetical protein